MITTKNPMPASSTGQKFWPLKFTLGHTKTQNQTSDKQLRESSSVTTHKTDNDLHAVKPRNRRLSSLLSHRRQPLEHINQQRLPSAMSVQNIHLAAARPAHPVSNTPNHSKKGPARVGPRQRTVSQTIGSPTGTLPKDQLHTHGLPSSPVANAPQETPHHSLPTIPASKQKESEKLSDFRTSLLDRSNEPVVEAASIAEPLPLADYHCGRLGDSGAAPTANKKCRSIPTASMVPSDYDMYEGRRQSARQADPRTRRNHVQRALRPVASCVTLRQSIPPSSPLMGQRTRSQRHSHDDTHCSLLPSPPKESKQVLHQDSLPTRSPVLSPMQKKRVHIQHGQTPSLHEQAPSLHDAKNRHLEDSGVFCDSRLADHPTKAWPDGSSERSGSGSGSGVSAHPTSVIRDMSNKSLYSFSGAEDADASLSSNSSYTSDPQVTHKQSVQVYKDRDTTQTTQADKIHYLQCQLETERATVLALQRQKEACNKDIAFLSQNVDELAEENQKLKEMCQSEQERQQDEYASIMNMLNATMGKMVQLAADKATQGVKPLAENDTGCVHYHQLQRAQQQVKVLRTTMEQFLRLGIFGHDQDLDPISSTCVSR